MISKGVLAFLLPLTMVLEIEGGLALMFGWQTCAAALLLMGFSLATGYIFHGGLNDPIQQIMFMKNISIAGGLLVLALNGAGRSSLDHKLYSDGA